MVPLLRKMDNDQYIPYAEVKKSFAVSNGTLKNWDAQGLLDTIRLPGGKRLYSRKSINKCFCVPDKPRSKYIYARVSSSHQKHDLDRQIESLQHEYPSHTIISDIGSGLNWKRKGFASLLELLHAGECEEIVVAHKDRLCRFGFELVEWIAQKHHCAIVVHNSSVESCGGATGATELAEDLLAITTYFTAKNNGMRSSANKQKRKRHEKDLAEADHRPEAVDQQVV